MDWLEVKVTINREAVDAVSEILMRFGADGVSILDNNAIDKEFEEINWDYIDESIIDDTGIASVSAYYDRKIADKAFLKGLNSCINELNDIFELDELKIETRTMADEDWQNEWRKYYKPFKIGKNLVIKPSWEEINVNENEIIIELDPGLAFGTGTHESTRMCMELLEEYVTNGKTLLDIGCGSGILSIIGAKLGCSNVLGIDIDPVAIQASLENIKVNNVQSKVTAKTAVLKDLEKNKYDIICANIVADVIIDISNNIKEYLDRNGIFIVSGIIKERKSEVKSKLISVGLNIIEEKNIGEWVAMSASWENSL